MHCAEPYSLWHINVDSDQAGRERLAAFGISVWKRMERISWMDKVTNEKVFALQPGCSP